ncbi:MAG: 50S ribosomal protein L4 [Bacilli bacterium]|jgi:large subunit ribosomal protein L4|nr:50S ribosomal protein L4 [Bacilli bacterium]
MAETKSFEFPVVTLAGEDAGKVSLSKEVFKIKDDNRQAVLDAILTERANARQATAKTKKRHEVSGGGKKPWRQKGTGRARAGSNRSPIWVGGGKVFGPDGNQNYTISQNKKAYALALKTVLSQKAIKGLIVVDSFKVAEISTKAVKADLDKLGLKGKTLVVAAPSDENFILSVGNIANVKVVSASNVSVYDVVNAQNLLVGKDEVKVIEGGLR